MVSEVDDGEAEFGEVDGVRGEFAEVEGPDEPDDGPDGEGEEGGEEGAGEDGEGEGRGTAPPADAPEDEDAEGEIDTGGDCEGGGVGFDRLDYLVELHAGGISGRVYQNGACGAKSAMHRLWWGLRRETVPLVGDDEEFTGEWAADFGTGRFSADIDEFAIAVRGEDEAVLSGGPEGGGMGWTSASGIERVGEGRPREDGLVEIGGEGEFVGDGGGGWGRVRGSGDIVTDIGGHVPGIRGCIRRRFLWGLFIYGGRGLRSGGAEGGDAEELSGVGAFDLGALWEAGDIDELVFRGEGAVYEAGATIDGSAKWGGTGGSGTAIRRSGGRGSRGRWGTGGEVLRGGGGSWRGAGVEQFCEIDGGFCEIGGGGRTLLG